MTAITFGWPLELCILPLALGTLLAVVWAIDCFKRRELDE